MQCDAIYSHSDHPDTCEPNKDLHLTPDGEALTRLGRQVTRTAHKSRAATQELAHSWCQTEDIGKSLDQDEVAGNDIGQLLVGIHPTRQIGRPQQDTNIET